MASSVQEKESGLVNAVDAMPFMLHVLLVVVITWLFLPVTSKGFIFLCVFIAYLFQVERWSREIERRRIESAEQKKINTKRTFNEGETLRWLNEGVRSMWPMCMEKFASKHFFGPMAPYFLDKYKPWIVKEAKMDIDSLRLGNTPPVFYFIRAFEQPPEGDHVAYEATMEFNSGDDMNAELSVQMRGGFWTTLYISRLHIVGKVMLSVKFLKGWPVVGRVRFCFASTPQLTMSCKPYYKNGFDLNLIPLVANSVEKMLHDAMGHCIVQPNVLHVDIEAIASALVADSRTQQGATGILKVENKSTLIVEILQATDLRVADRNGLSDPFVEIQFGHSKTRKTKVVTKTLNPKWRDELHHFSVDNWGMPNMLTLRVRDWDRFLRRPSSDLGILVVPVNDGYRDGKRHVINLPLKDVSTGHLQFAITVNDTHPPRILEEQRRSDAGCETVTQEIRSAVDYVVDKSPIGGSTTKMKRSKSDTNLEKLRTPLNYKRKKEGGDMSTGEPSLLEALQEQTPIDEMYDVITMPYGPRGAFTICRPGLLQAPITPPAKAINNAQIPNSTGLNQDEHEPVDAKAPSRRRNIYPFRGRRKKWLDNGQSETMSEQSGSLESIDISEQSTELKSIHVNEKYHGPVRMDVIVTTSDTIAPAEPPEMYTPRSAPQLQPILSGKSASTESAFNSNSVAVPAIHPAASEPPGQDVDENGSPSFGQPMVLLAGTGLEEGPEGEQDELAASQPQRPGRPPQGRTEKPSLPTLPKIWYKKMKSLASKRTKKRRQDTNGIAYSSELKCLSGEYGEGDRNDWDQMSRTQSFTNEFPLDANHTSNGGTLGSARGCDSPEQRMLMMETPLNRASGSQSDRSNWASKMKKFVRDQRKSPRLESLHVKEKLETLNRDPSLNSISERSGPQRNGKVLV